MCTVSAPIILRNVVKFKYPIKRVLQSIIGLVDEAVLSVDPKSDDDTVGYIFSLAAELKNELNIKVIESVWDLDNISRNGIEFSRQTNIAIDVCSCDYIISLQADEAFLETDHQSIKNEIDFMENNGYNSSEMLRIYFYGSIDVIRSDWSVSINRLFKRGTMRSTGDGMFCEPVGDNKVFKSKVCIYHYSRIGDPNIISSRVRFLDGLFHKNEDLLDTNNLPPYEFNTFNFDCFNKPEVEVGRHKISGNVLFKYYGSHPKSFIGYTGEPE
jgi:hypothetical protein